MEEKLKSAIERFQKAPTSLEAYKAIFDFVEVVLTVPEYIASAEEEGEVIRQAMIKLNADKGWNYGLKGRDLDEHNKRRAEKHDALFQLDPIFPLQNLHSIYTRIQTENIADSAGDLFHRFKPDDPLPSPDKEEYQMFLDKVYKRILPFLKKDKKIAKRKRHVSKRTVKPLSFDVEKSTLHLTGKKIEISIKKNGRTNGHYVLLHLFTSEEGLRQSYPYAEIAEDTFKSEYEEKAAWKKYYRACVDINEKIRKQCGIDDFLIFTTGRTGWTKVNEKYLK